MKQAASHLQIFIGMRDIEKRVEEESKSLVTLQNDENFYQSDSHITYSEIVPAILIGFLSLVKYSWRQAQRILVLY